MDLCEIELMQKIERGATGRSEDGDFALRFSGRDLWMV
jgi:hypothetical protein